MQGINSPKYVGITENYLCFHRVRKAPRWSRAGYDVSLFKRIWIFILANISGLRESVILWTGKIHSAAELWRGCTTLYSYRTVTISVSYFYFILPTINYWLLLGGDILRSVVDLELISIASLEIYCNIWLRTYCHFTTYNILFITSWAQYKRTSHCQK